MKTNHKWTRINTNRPEERTGAPPSTTSGAKVLLQYGVLGVTMSWDDGFPGARASRPHKAWHSLGHLPHLDQPGTEPWLCFGLADGVTADVVAACKAARKLSGGQRDSMRARRPRSRVIRNRMRAGRPRSQAMPPRRCRGGANRIYFGCQGTTPAFWMRRRSAWERPAATPGSCSARSCSSRGSSLRSNSLKGSKGEFCSSFQRPRRTA